MPFLPLLVQCHRKSGKTTTKNFKYNPESHKKKSKFHLKIICHTKKQEDLKVNKKRQQMQALKKVELELPKKILKQL